MVLAFAKKKIHKAEARKILYQDLLDIRSFNVDADPLKDPKTGPPPPPPPNIYTHYYVGEARGLLGGVPFLGSFRESGELRCIFCKPRPSRLVRE